MNTEQAGRRLQNQTSGRVSGFSGVLRQLMKKIWKRSQVSDYRGVHEKRKVDLRFASGRKKIGEFLKFKKLNCNLEIIIL